MNDGLMDMGDNLAMPRTVMPRKKLHNVPHPRICQQETVNERHTTHMVQLIVSLLFELVNVSSCSLMGFVTVVVAPPQVWLDGINV